MKRNATPKNATPKNATPKNATPKNATRRAWVPYLPAIITAATALVEVLLQHFHP